MPPVVLRILQCPFPLGFRQDAIGSTARMHHSGSRTRISGCFVPCREHDLKGRLVSPSRKDDRLTGNTFENGTIPCNIAGSFLYDCCWVVSRCEFSIERWTREQELTSNVFGWQYYALRRFTCIIWESWCITVCRSGSHIEMARTVEGELSRELSLSKVEFRDS